LVEAEALIEAARSGATIDVERARAFARAVLELDEIGRLALAVLDGGLFVRKQGRGVGAGVARPRGDGLKLNGFREYPRGDHKKRCVSVSFL
jgi:hypothetical protein